MNHLISNESFSNDKSSNNILQSRTKFSSEAMKEAAEDVYNLGCATNSVGKNVDNLSPTADNWKPVCTMRCGAYILFGNMADICTLHKLVADDIICKGYRIPNLNLQNVVKNRKWGNLRFLKERQTTLVNLPSLNFCHLRIVFISGVCVCVCVCVCCPSSRDMVFLSSM